MKDSVKIGLSFGLTSGVITTLGLIVGLFSSTNSRLAILGGILTIAIADSLSDALGIHISQESSNSKHKEVWIATLWTFLSKFIFTLTFVIPIILFELKTAVMISIIWGLIVLIFYNYKIAKDKKVEPFKIIFEHVLIAVVVVILTYFVGKLINLIFV